MFDLTKEIIEIVKKFTEFDDDLEICEKLKDLGIDSLKNVLIISSIEEKFNFEYDMADLDPAKLISIDDLIKFTEKYVRIQ